MKMPNSMNDTWILHLSNLYKMIVIGYLFCFNKGKKVIKPYLIVENLLSISLVDDPTKKKLECLEYCPSNFIQQIFMPRKKHCAKCIWDLEEDLSKIGFEN